MSDTFDESFGIATALRDWHAAEHAQEESPAEEAPVDTFADALREWHKAEHARESR